MKSAVLSLVCFAGLTVTAAAAEPADKVVADMKAVGQRFAAACPAPATLSHKVGSRLARRPDYYTQGLLYHKGTLYESTGLYGKSGLYKIDPVSGAYRQLTANPKQYFGEGLARLNDRLFQLTWKEGTVFVYDLDAKGILPSPSMSYPREGWGLTTDDRHLIASDGSAQLHFLNPADLSIARSLSIFLERRPVENLNELEYVRGKIFANVYMTDTILRIDPATGCADGTLDLSGLLSKAERAALAYGEVLNGIAYDPAEDVFYVTGKHWPAIYKLKIGN